MRWVDLVPTWFQQGRTSSRLGPLADFTPTDAAITKAAREAEALGLRVVIKPQLNLDDGAWRGSIEPSYPSQWWRGYDALIAHYARLAQRLGPAELVVGTELVGLSGDTGNWERLVSSVRQLFSGYRRATSACTRWPSSLSCSRSSGWSRRWTVPGRGRWRSPCWPWTWCT